MRADLLTPFFAQGRVPAGDDLRAWERLLGQARRAGLTGRVATQLSAAGRLGDVAAGPRRHLHWAMRLLERERNEVAWEVDSVRRALAAVDTPLVLLKGAAYLIGDLLPAKGRLFADVDIMVARTRLAEAESALLAAGWIGEAHDPYTQRYYREWMHELPPLRHVRRGSLLDVHHTIAPPTSRYSVDGARLLERITPIAGHDGLHMLAPVDLVLHSATHLFQEGELWHGLRDLLDLNDLLTGFAQLPGFWTGLLDRADELGLQVPLSHALHHVGRIFGTRPPAEFERRVKGMDGALVSRWLMAALLGSALRPEHPSCDGAFSRMSRFLLYVRSHWLRMPPHRLLPHLVRKALVRTDPIPR